MYLCISADDVSMFHIFNWKNTSVFQETKPPVLYSRLHDLKKALLFG